MAINIGLSLADHGYDEATNSNLVTVKVTASWSGGSYNKNAHTTIEINGVTETFKAYINGAQTNSGSTTIYDSTVAIDRSAANNVYVKVTVDAGGTTGQKSAEGILPLSDSPTGGGDGGDDDDEWEDKTYAFNLNFTLSGGVWAEIRYRGSNKPLYTITESGSVNTDLDQSYAVVVIKNPNPNVYELISKVTLERNNGSKEQSITKKEDEDRLEVSGSIAGYYNIVAYVVPKSAVRIDNGESLEPHAVYIDNGTGWDLYAPYIDNGTGWEPCV